MIDIAHRIKQLRTLKKLSQKQVAIQLGIDQGQYSRIESGKVEPTLSSLQKVAQVFDISLSELLKEQGDINEEINLPLLEKVKLIDQLEEDEKNSLMTIIDMAIAKKRLKDNLSNLLAS
jgi:transcriptional regulator with XRE-family HTH domain